MYSKKEAYKALDDEAVMTWTLDTKLSAQEQLYKVIDWHVAVALDPKLNGGYVLAKVKK